MKILLSAFACEPGQGSEAGIGWGIAWALAQRHQVEVLTTPRHRAAIEQFLAGRPSGNLSFSYFDLPDVFLRCIRTSATWQIYYHLWQLRAAHWASPIVKRFDPDVIHHVTYGRYWAPSSLWKLKRPFVWGPVGGGDTTPDAFVSSYSARGQRLEKLRRIARAVGERGPAVVKTARHAAFAFATTPETADRMKKLGVKNLSLSAHAALADDELSAIAEDFSSSRVRFCCVGNLLHWKGFHLAIDAFAAAMLPAAELVVIGDGPERSSLVARSVRLGLTQNIRFAGRLPRAETVALIGSCTALVHPSLHDSGGFVCLEAMARSRPVVCLNLGGPGIMVTPETGFSIPAIDPEQSIAALADALRKLAEQPALARTLGKRGLQRVREHFTWSQKIIQFEATYRDVLSNETRSR